MIETLAIKKFEGKVLLLGPPDRQSLRRPEGSLRIGVAILPTLATPWR